VNRLLERQEEGGVESAMRKHYDKEFKAKVALDAVRSEKTIQEIAKAFAVHPNLVSLWKRQLLENAGKLFE
jgi:transposase-like protein